MFRQYVQPTLVVLLGTYIALRGENNKSQRTVTTLYLKIWKIGIELT